MWVPINWSGALPWLCCMPMDPVPLAGLSCLTSVRKNVPRPACSDLMCQGRSLPYQRRRREEGLGKETERRDYGREIRWINKLIGKMETLCPPYRRLNSRENKQNIILMRGRLIHRILLYVILSCFKPSGFLSMWKFQHLYFVLRLYYVCITKISSINMRDSSSY